MNYEDEFQNDLTQLIQLLKQIINRQKHLPESSQAGRFHPDGKGPQINIYIFPLLSITPDELEELEHFSESQDFEDDLGNSGKSLSPGDLEFLRRNGIRF